MFTVIVCGGKVFEDYHPVFRTLSTLCDRHKLWQGAYDPDKPNRALIRIALCEPRGEAETAAWAWAKAYMASFEVYSLDPAHGIRAQAIRNKEMIEKEKPDLILSFGKETNAEEIKAYARKLKIPVQDVKS